MLRIIVNRHVVLKNAKTGERKPPLSIKRSGQPVEYAERIRLPAGAVLIYDPDKPLQNGARVWIEAEDAEVIKPA